MSSAARCRRCSASIISRVVKRSSPRPSAPSSTSSGALRIAPMTALNCSIPSLCRCANIAMSRRVKVDCWCVIASSAMEGSAMMRAPLLRAISRCISARSAASIPSPSIRCAGAPIWLCGSSAMPCASRLRWSMRASMSSSARPLVGQLRPAFAPTLDHLGAVPVPHLLAEAVFVHGSHGQHDMGVGLGRPVLGHVPMHIEVGDHALIDKLRLHEVAGEFDALCSRHLARKGELDLAGELGVLPDLERLDIVPEPFAVAPCLGRILWQHDLGMDHAALVGEVVTALKPVVAQPRGRSVGGGGHRAGAGLAADDLDVKMIDRHRDPNITTAKRTSE